MPDKAERNAAATTERLLLAAQRRFTVLGYEGTTTRDVAADAGVNVSLISRYFGGKDGLHQAVLERSRSRLDETEPGERPDPVDGFIAHMDAADWPDFGAHPLLLLLRDRARDAGSAQLRNQAIDIALRHIDPDGKQPLRAQLVLALFYGIVSLRGEGGVEPLASADAGELEDALRDAITALLG